MHDLNPLTFTWMAGGLVYHDNQVQLENLFTIINSQHVTIQTLLDLLNPPLDTLSL